jgi:NDP-sugar pyrophosphorylase family protein
MKAIILAGGFATRLRPISYVIPKLLFPVAGKPMIYWTLDLLRRSRVDEVILGVNYLAEELRKSVGDDYRGIRIKYSLERLPLGTAGPIKLASQMTQLTETFIVMNGDIITNINFHEMLRCHKFPSAEITDALHEVEDPAQFGVVELDKASRIIRFVEKPDKKDAPSHLINAGIYLIEPSVLKQIPSGRKVSLEREIFPGLAERGKLRGFELSDYWFDIGNLSDYRKANFVLAKKITGMSVRLGAGSVAKNFKVMPPILIGKHTTVGHETRLGPNVILGKNVLVGKRVMMSNSIIFDDVQIGDGSVVTGAIIASNSTVGKGVRIERGTIISSNVSISDGVRVGKGAVIHPFKELTRHINACAHVM